MRLEPFIYDLFSLVLILYHNWELMQHLK